MDGGVDGVVETLFLNMAWIPNLQLPPFSATPPYEEQKDDLISEPLGTLKLSAGASGML